MDVKPDEFERYPELSQGLQQLYPLPPVPARVDERILNLARAELARRGRWRPLRWVGAVAAVTGAIFLGRLLLRGPISPRDLDGNRRVDIVDALVLAHQIQSGHGRDVNGDGRIDQLDVDAIGMDVVQLDGGMQ